MMIGQFMMKSVTQTLFATVPFITGDLRLQKSTLPHIVIDRGNKIKANETKKKVLTCSGFLQTHHKISEKKKNDSISLFKERPDLLVIILTVKSQAAEFPEASEHM